jgi:hypothetical protein
MRALFNLIMKRLQTVVFACLLAHTAQAADISIVAQETPNHPAVILIKGPMKLDDHRKDVDLFSAYAGYQKNAIVFLDSPGGNVQTAIQIGLVIYNHGFSTAVADSVLCASGCGLIWLGGKEKFMGKYARIGFHAAATPKLEISSSGNAMVGAYLAQIGIKDFGSINFITKAPPTEMTWLTQIEAARFIIPFVKQFSITEPKWAWAQQELDPSKKAARAIEKETVTTTVGTTGHIIHFVTTIGQDHLPTVLQVKENIVLRAPPSEDHCVPSGTRACHCRLIDHVMICNAIPLPVTETIVPPVPQRACRRLDEACPADPPRAIEQSPGPTPAVQIQSNGLIAQALRRIENGDVAGAREMLAAAVDDTQGLFAFALAETYDPKMLLAWGTRGAVADVARARALYRKALNLGVASAYERLEALK